jgi:hypothetical protein
VAFESRKLNLAELSYNVMEKDVVHALPVWRCYLEGADFTVYTDHVSNTFFQTQPNLSASTLVEVSAALWGFRVEVPQRSE